jgi:large subunit ribosomal protein L32
MALPKYKLSRSRTRRRKATWKRALALPNLSECPQCHKPKLPHRACTKCGYYKGRNVLTVKTTG